MKDNKVERIRHNAMMFGQQFLLADVGVFDQVFGGSLAAMVSAQTPHFRERVYSPLDTLRLFIGQVLSTDRACQQS